MVEDSRVDCASHCRELANETYDLADRAELPEIIGDYLAIAAKLVHCAERAEMGKAAPLRNRRALS
jgi:hypothetical protein